MMLGDMKSEKMELRDKQKGAERASEDNDLEPQGRPKGAKGSQG